MVFFDKMGMGNEKTTLWVVPGCLGRTAERIRLSSTVTGSKFWVGKEFS
jgi:hypothetical protein